MQPETPDDVANLCNVAELDTNHYKVFTPNRRKRIDPFSAEIDPPQAAPERNLASMVEQQAESEITPKSAPEMSSRRWTVLHSAAEVNPNADSDDYRVVAEEIHVPTLSVFSTAGGVGKTSIVAALARALSRSGQRLLMVHGVEEYTLTLHFGGQSGKPGRLRTFFPPTRKEGQISVVAHDFDVAPHGVEIDGWLQREVASVQGEVDRVLVEISRLGSEDQHFLGLSHATLVVLVPDIRCLLSVPKLKKMLEQQNETGFRKVNPYFLLNKFDANSAFHNEIRDQLRKQLGSRLLPFTIRRSDLVSEALASGMTVLDYAPKASIVDDLLRLAAWAGELSNVRELPAAKSVTKANAAIAAV
jgi:cellulose synthase operon protein YhjQ